MTETHSTTETEVMHAENAPAGETHELKHEQTLFAEPVMHVGSFPVTNALITSWVTVAIIAVIALALRLSIRTVPGKLQHFFEVLIEGGLDLADQVTGDRRISQRVFPIAISIFFFILISNWIDRKSVV